MNYFLLIRLVQANPLVNIVDVTEMPVVIKGIIKVLLGQLLLDRWVRLQEWPEWDLFSPALGGVWLDQVVGRLPGHPGVN